MNKAKVLGDFRKSTENLLEGISDFPEKRFNDTPVDGGWSAGQVVDHLIKIETSTVRLFKGDTQKADRNPGEKIQEIKRRFLDYQTKMTAYGPIVPDAEPRDKQKTLDKMQDIRQRLMSLIEIQDMTLLLTSFSHPLFGTLTRIEWIYFNIFHSRRHLNQIKQIEMGFH